MYHTRIMSLKEIQDSLNEPDAAVDMLCDWYELLSHIGKNAQSCVEKDDHEGLTICVMLALHMAMLRFNKKTRIFIYDESRDENHVYVAVPTFSNGMKENQEVQKNLTFLASCMSSVLKDLQENDPEFKKAITDKIPRRPSP